MNLIGPWSSMHEEAYAKYARFKMALFKPEMAFTKPEEALDRPEAHAGPVEPNIRPRKFPFQTEWPRSVIRRPEKPDSGYLSRIAHLGFAPWSGQGFGAS